MESTLKCGLSGPGEQPTLAPICLVRRDLGTISYKNLNKLQYSRAELTQSRCGATDGLGAGTYPPRCGQSASYT
jgi:hypothetical protein